MKSSLFLAITFMVYKDASPLSAGSLLVPPMSLRSHRAATVPMGVGGRDSFHLFTKKCGPTTHRRRNLEMQATAAPWVWALGHVVGGATGTPIVMSGTRKQGWYNKINLPSWTPPNGLFGPVWTCLYACMGLAAAKIYDASGATTARKQFALGMWAFHYVLNVIWAPIFFGFQRLRLGLIISCLQLISLAAVSVIYYSIEPMAAYLLIPYASWLLFATRLNDAICKRNPTKLGYNEAKFQADLLRLQREAAKFAFGK